jgi:hypothetical protein
VRASDAIAVSRATEVIEVIDAFDDLDPVTQTNGRAGFAQPRERRGGQQLGQAASRQQQVGGAWAGGQRVAQDAQEHDAAGLACGRVEGSNAQRIDEVSADRKGQAGAEVGHGAVRLAPEAHASPAGGRGEQGETLAPAPAGAPKRGDGERRHDRSPAEPQAPPVSVDEGQRAAQEGVAFGHTDVAQQAKGLDVGADTDVLPVVEHGAARNHVAGAAAGLRRHLEQGHMGAAADRFDRRRQPRPAGADHSDARAARGHYRPRQFVRMAIQSLRNGVSEMRWCRTWKPSASISRRRLR